MQTNAEQSETERVFRGVVAPPPTGTLEDIALSGSSTRHHYSEGGISSKVRGLDGSHFGGAVEQSETERDFRGVVAPPPTGTVEDFSLSGSSTRHRYSAKSVER